MSLGRLKFSIIILTLAAIAYSGVLPPPAHAASPSSILIDMAPENPAPGENVNITLGSYASNLDSVLISWSVNGKNISSGIGKKAFSVSAGGAGIETRITARVSLPDGTIEKVVIIRPAVMVL